jgi:hypothetical protein
MKVRSVRQDREAMLETGKCVLRPPQSAQNDAQDQDSIGLIGLRGNGAAKAGLGLNEIAKVVKNHAQIAQGLPAIGHQGQCPAITGGSLLGPPQRLQDIAEIGVVGMNVPGQPDSLPEERERRLGMTALEGDDAQHGKTVGMVRLDPENGAQASLRLGQLTGGKVADGLIEKRGGFGHGCRLMLPVPPADRRQIAGSDYFGGGM